MRWTIGGTADAKGLPPCGMHHAWDVQGRGWQPVRTRFKFQHCAGDIDMENIFSCSWLLMTQYGNICPPKLPVLLHWHIITAPKYSSSAPAKYTLRRCIDRARVLIEETFLCRPIRDRFQWRCSRAMRRRNSHSHQAVGDPSTCASE
jgi:hypothetical protein